ncbi:MAG: AAA family ATPase [Lachnospiraceae bacterium]|nr:AAA family ATPase [Lachnospiraceae bacterium]
MLGAYYGKKYPSEAIFDNLNISRSKNYKVHLNKYNIINISMNCLPDLLAVTGDEFIFMIDEWDYIFSHDLYRENQGDFLEFLRYLLKDRPYVALAYMTGVLPVKKYSTGSALNMFDEYTMLNDSLFDEYFGFTEKEVEALYSRQSKLSLEEIAEWYNGYHTDDGRKIYNPRSVVLALLNGKCRSYWTRSGKMDEVLFFLKYNIGEVRDDVVKMVNHMPVRMEIIEEYTAGQENPANREEIYAAMIIYGLLSYHDGELGIPNKELMLEFQKALKDDIFYPRKSNLPGIVVELNAGGTPEAAIEQIRDKEYFEKLKKENIEKILLVGINYSADKKEHQCRIEEF